MTARTVVNGWSRGYWIACDLVASPWQHQADIGLRVLRSIASGCNNHVIARAAQLRLNREKLRRSAALPPQVA
jgi:hypothetical protein